MADWCLGIDLGHTRTRAAISDGDAARLVRLEPDGESWIHSCVFRADDGEIFVSGAARRLSALRPEGFEPQPRRLLGQVEVFLGGGPVEVVELIAAILQTVNDAPILNAGAAPARVVLTHPGHWGDGRQRALLDAAERAGSFHPELLSEAEAASQTALHETEPGQHVAVLDIGASRCEATVLLRGGDGFSFAGPPAERDPIGGDDIDDRIISHLGELCAPGHGDRWRALREPSNARERRLAAALRDEVVRGKEALSSSEACELSVPGISPEVQLTRAELERLAADIAEGAVDLLELVLARAGLEPADLARVTLAGGTGGMPLVQDTIWRRLSVRPFVEPDPGGTVARGAALWTAPGRRPPPQAVASSPSGGRDGGRSRSSPTRRTEGAADFVPTLVLVTTSFDSGKTGGEVEGICECSALLTFGIGQLGRGRDTAGAVRLEDSFTTATDTRQLTEELRQRGPLQPDLVSVWSGPAPIAGLGGWEIRFAPKGEPARIVLVQRLLASGGRALVASAPEELSAFLGEITRRTDPPVAGRFEVGWTAPVRPGWTVTEQLVLRRAGSGHSVTVRCHTAGRPSDLDSWKEEELAGLLVPRAERPTRRPGLVCGQLEGEIVTIRWNDHGRPMRTKVGLAVVGAQGFSVTISLPREEQSQFPALARHAQLRPEARALLDGR